MHRPPPDAAVTIATLEESVTPVTLVRHATEPASTVMGTSSIERGRRPPPGVQMPAYRWDDLPDAAPPAKMQKGAGSYVVYEGMEVGPDLRIAYSTIISAARGFDGLDVRADSRLNIQRRLAFELMDRERESMTRLTAGMRNRLARRLARQGRVVRRVEADLARRILVQLIRTEARVGYWLINSLRRASNAAVQVPDQVYTHWLRARGHLENRLGRRSLWQGMKDPHGLTTEQKGVVMFLSTTLLTSVIFALNNVFSVLFPGQAPAYRNLLSAFFWRLATAVALPFPPTEPLVIPAYLSAGPVLALGSIVAGAVAGAWFVYFIGDSLHGLIQRQTEGKPRMRRLVEWLQRHTQRFGGALLATFMAVPFLPDTLALYVFAASGLRFRTFMLAALAGATIRYGLVLAVLMFYGQDRLMELIN